MGFAFQALTAARQIITDGRPKLCKRILACQQTVQMFEDSLVQPLLNIEPGSADKMLHVLNELVLEHAKGFFTKDGSGPRKHWLSDDAWLATRPIGPLRKQLSECRRLMRRTLMHDIFMSWSTSSWTGSADMPRLHWLEAALLRRLTSQHRVVRRLVRRDRLAMLDGMASTMSRRFAGA